LKRDGRMKHIKFYPHSQPTSSVTSTPSSDLENFLPLWSSIFVYKHASNKPYRNPWILHSPIPHVSLINKQKTIISSFVYLEDFPLEADRSNLNLYFHINLNFYKKMDAPHCTYYIQQKLIQTCKLFLLLTRWFQK